MQPNRPVLRRLILAALFAGAWPFAALGQASWPDRPVRFIVPLPPGGPSDIVLRGALQKMQTTLRQPLVLENKPGPKAFDWHIFKRLWAFMRPFKLRVYVGVFMLLVYTGTMTFYPLIPGYGTKAVKDGDTHGLVLWTVIFLVNSVVMWLSQ